MGAKKEKIAKMAETYLKKQWLNIPPNWGEIWTSKCIKTEDLIQIDQKRTSLKHIELLEIKEKKTHFLIQ